MTISSMRLALLLLSLCSLKQVRRVVARESDGSDSATIKSSIPFNQRWSISRPRAHYENYDLKTLYLEFDISAFPDPTRAEVKLMHGKQCEIEMKDSSALATTNLPFIKAELKFGSIVSNEITANPGFGENQYTRKVKITFDIEDLNQEFDQSELQFCNRLSLHNDNGILVNWLDTQLTVPLPPKSSEITKEEHEGTMQQNPKEILVHVLSATETTE